MHRDADKHLYVDVGQDRLVIDGNIMIEDQQAGELGLTNMTGAASDVDPTTTRDIKGDPLIHGATVASIPGDWKVISSISNSDGTVTVDYYLIDANGNDILSVGSFEYMLNDRMRVAANDADYVNSFNRRWA